MTALEQVPAAEWDDRLDALGLTDAYLRRGYLAASAQLTPGEPVLLHLAGDGGDVVFAALLRSDPVDLVTPYGYGGPVAVGSDPPMDAFAQAYGEWCRAHGATSTFAVFHPLFANARHAPGFHVQPIGDTIAWSLAPGADLMAGMHRHHRRMARRALNAGAEVRITEPHELESLAGFRALYEQTMRRAHADPFYFFAKPYWAALAAAVPTVAVEVWHDGAQHAGVLGLTGTPWLHYHLGANSDAGRALGASHLALYSLACWGQERGYELLHLGGGVGGRRDSLFTYKERFAPGGERAAAIGKAVHDPERYRALTGQSAVSYEGFFPAYRAAH